MPDRLDGKTMGKIGRMHGRKRGFHVALTRRMDTIEMRQPDRAPRLIESRNRIQPVAKPRHHHLGITLKRIGG